MLDALRVAQGLSRVASILRHEVFPAPFQVLRFSRGEVSLEALRMMETGGAVGKIDIKTSGVTFDDKLAGVSNVVGPNRSGDPREGRQPRAVVGGIGGFLKLSRLVGSVMHEDFGGSAKFDR